MTGQNSSPKPRTTAITCGILAVIAVLTFPLWGAGAVLGGLGFLTGITQERVLRDSARASDAVPGMWEELDGDYGRTGSAYELVTIEIDGVDKPTIDGVVDAYESLRTKHKQKFSEAAPPELSITTPDDSYQATSAFGGGTDLITDSVDAAETLIAAGGTVDIQGVSTTLTGDLAPVRAFVASPGLAQSPVDYYLSPEDIYADRGSRSDKRPPVVHGWPREFDEALAINDRARTLFVELGVDQYEPPRTSIYARTRTLNLLEKDDHSGDCDGPVYDGRLDEVEVVLSAEFSPIEIRVTCHG